MGYLGANSAFGLMARLVGVAAGGLALANCSGSTAKLDPRYGVAASPRVVQLGEKAPKGGGKYRVGQPYTVAGKVYVPQENTNYSEVGYASWYGDDFHGRYTSNGEVFDENAISAAHPTLPLPSYVRVTNLSNHRSIVVRVNDRGPFVHNRIIDLSIKTAKLLGFYDEGLAKVKVEYVGQAPLNGSDDAKLMATLRHNGPAPKPVMVADEEAPPKQVKLASADSKPYVPTFFDNRPMRDVPAPPERPYQLGEGDRSVATHDLPAMRSAPPVASRRNTNQFAAATRPRPVEQEAAAQPSPVSAYAAPANDGHVTSGFLNGRGLY